ncbi:MFS transporter [Bartonella tamiae]|uniref:Major facilitator superfamily associated domain-containing protein n=1 Tax=Bartonella tamiae Th239 TaxID=1094558 RepID=J1K1W7_9HYPH|nr:MFS transporter [Bartonella tamiae]EJF91075.1 hypothetical protein ME5_00407 [Bartonella tamiae Th239]EJF93260.1 hypothetical protein MEG_01474 [Bartonella tamiae Th307]
MDKLKKKSLLNLLQADWHLPVGFFGFYLPAGILLSYLPSFLNQKGLSPSEIAIAFSSVFAIKLFTGPLLSYWTDFQEKQQITLTFLGVLTIISSVILGVSSQFWLLWIGIIMMSICRNYYQSLLEAFASATNFSNKDNRYGLMRGIGSIAICIGVIMFGGLWSSGQMYQLYYLPTLVLISGIILTYAVAKKNNNISKKKIFEFDKNLNDDLINKIILYMASCFLIGSNGVFYSTATLILEKENFISYEISLLWIFTFFIEAIGFIIFDYIRLKISDSIFFYCIIIITLFRWWILTNENNYYLIILAFALHVASFSWVHVFLVNWIRNLWSDRYAATGQSLYIAVAHGVGMASAAFLSSMLLPSIGSHVYFISLTMTLIGATMVLLWQLIFNKKRKKHEKY